MQRQLTLEYWQDGGDYVGRIKEAPGVCSHGKDLEELERNVRRAYRLMVDDETRASRDDVRTKAIAFEVYYAPAPGEGG